MSNAADEIRSRTEAFVASLSGLIRQAALEAASAALGGGTAVAAPAKVVPTRGRGRPRKAVVAALAPTSAKPNDVAAKRGRGRPRKTAASAPAAEAPPAAKPAKVAPASKAVDSRKAAPKRAVGQKRPPGELARLIERLGEYIKANPGRRMEDIAKALGASALELRFPARKLVTAKKVRTEGQKQNTVYFPM